MADTGTRSRKNGNQAGRLCITCIVFIFAVVMSMQIVKVYQKDQEYIAKQQSLEQQVLDEQEKKTGLETYESYIKSAPKEYVEEIAKSKLGLLYGNEVIFRERK